MTIENIKQLMDGVDIATLLPDIEAILRFVATVGRYALLIGPVVLLFLGLHYFLLPPREANYTTGYRFRWGMASVEAWRFMQQLAGAIWILLGLGLVIAMGITAGTVGDLEPMTMLALVGKRLLLQAVLIFASRLIINLTVLLRYDRKGQRRLTWRELYQA